MAPWMFTVTAAPLGFRKGVLSGTIGDLEMLARAKNVTIPTIKAKGVSRRTFRFEIEKNSGFRKTISRLRVTAD